MAIEIVGDVEAMAALGLRENLPRRNRFASSADVSTTPMKFATVNIPDIRVPGFSDSKWSVRNPGSGHLDVSRTTRNSQAITSEHEAGHSTISEPTARGTKTLTSLQSIKANIERQSTGNAIEGIFEDIARVDARPESIAVENRNGSESDFSQMETGLQPKSTEDCFLATLNPRDSQVVPIAEAIVEKFPVGGNTVVAFAGTERNEQLENVVANVAVALRQAVECRVLVIDSDLTDGFLSRLLKATDSVGLTDLSKNEVTWEQALSPTSDASIHFLPVGGAEVAFPEKMAILLKKVIPNIASQYDYVVVNVGDAHGAIAKLWSSYTNGTFLLVSMTETNQNVAKSAVAQLNSFGARLIGCVVSDTDVLS